MKILLELLALAACLLLVTLGGCATPPVAVDEMPSVLHIDRLEWSEKASSEGHVLLLAHVEEWLGFEALKEFTRTADPHFTLLGGGHAVDARVGTGGVTSRDGTVRFVALYVHGSQKALGDGQYTLVARNEGSERLWVVRDGVAVSGDG